MDLSIGIIIIIYIVYVCYSRTLVGKSITTISSPTRRPPNPTSSCLLWPRSGNRLRRRSPASRCPARLVKSVGPCRRVVVVEPAGAGRNEVGAGPRVVVQSRIQTRGQVGNRSLLAIWTVTQAVIQTQIWKLVVTEVLSQAL